MKRSIRLLFSVFALPVLLATGLPARIAVAGSTIVVDSDADTTATDALCTLREAITNANSDAATYPDCTAGSGNDTITFAGNYTITLGSMLPEITDTDDLTITGNGTSNTIIQAAADAGTATYRIVKVNGSGVGATFEYMTLRYGVEASGGAINVSSAAVTLNQVALSDNQVKTIGGVSLNGGAISINSGSLTLNNCTLNNNSIAETDSNTLHGHGGAIFAGAATVNLNNSTLSGNSAKRGGGGIYAYSGTVNINYSTIAGNTSDSDDDTVGDGGGIARNTGTLNLKSSLVAGNKKGATSSADNDCTGTITSQDYNLTGSGTGCSLSGTYDATVTPSTVFSALLGALADNGGETQTHALIAGSAAVDAVPDGTNSCGSGSFALDQRGGARPYNSSCDIGAYEKHPLAVSTSGSDSGNCTLDDCLTLAYAYGKASSGDTINLAAGTFTETTDFNIANTITITGTGAGSTIVQQAAEAGTASHRFFKVNTGATAVVQDLTLRNGVEASGGAINVQGALTLNNVALTGNRVKNLGTALNGGAISVIGGTLTINNSTLSGNAIAETDTDTLHGHGGAIFAAAGTVNLNNVTLSGNSAKRGGGAIYTKGGTVNVNYSTLADNTADSDADGDGDGGGIHRNGGTINLTGNILAGNKKGSGADSDCSGTSGINSSGYNLAGSGTGCSLSGTGDGTVDPATVFTSLLGSLANNGGTTDTHRLYGGNAAQDAIPSGTIGCGSSPFDQDQRGEARPYNGSCDMGAYESQDARPSVAMSTTAGSTTGTSPIPVTVAFSESVTGFTADDVVVGNASLGNFAGSGADYSFDLTPSGDGTVTADISAGAAQDSAYNYNTAASQLSVAYDGNAPAVGSFAATTPANSTDIPITAFTATDIVGVTGYLITSSSTPPAADAEGWAATAPTTYAVAGEGSYTLYPWAKDALGHVSSVYGSPAGVTVDTTAPVTTSIDRLNPSTGTTNADTLVFRVIFSEEVTGVDADGSDFTVPALTDPVLSVSQVSADTYDLTVTGGNLSEFNGTIDLNLNAPTIEDLALNSLTRLMVILEQHYVMDNTAPTITVNNPTTDPATSKTLTAGTSDGTLTMSVTTGSICDGTLTFVAYADQTFTSEDDNGKKVCYSAVDTAGNTAYSLSNAIAGIDTTAPTVDTFSAAATSASLAIPITDFSASDGVGVTGYLITESSSAPATGDGGWSETAPTSHTVAASGSHTLYPWAKDAAGNVSAVYGSPAGVTVYAYTLSGGTSLTEGNSGTQSVTLTLSRSDTAGAASVELSITGGATAGRDYTGPTLSGSGVTLSGSTVQFEAGAASASLGFSLAGDSVYEGEEAIEVALAGVESGTVGGSPQTLTIGDDDTAPFWSVQVEPATIIEGDGTLSETTFTVTLTGATELPVVVTYATTNGTAQAGSDFVAAGGTIQLDTTWDDQLQSHLSSTSWSIDVQAIGDTATEGDESFSLDLSAPTNSTLLTAGASVTLIDDESYSDTVCGNDSLFYATTYTGSFYCSSATRIRAGLGVTVAAGGSVVYSAPKVQLLSGVTVASGSYFHAGQNLTAASRPEADNQAREARQSRVVPQAEGRAPASETRAARRLGPEELPAGLLERLAGAGYGAEEMEPLIGDGAGHWIVFATDAPLLAADRNGAEDVYAYRMADGELRLLSRTPTGQAGNGASGWPAIDGAGERVVFQSLASDLVAGDGNGLQDIFAYDLAGGELRNLTLGAEQPSAHPALDGSGYLVLFDQGAAGERLLLRDDPAQRDAPADPLAQGPDSHHPAVSADGRYAVWIEGDGVLSYRDNVRGVELAIPCPPQLIPFAEQARPLFGPDGGWVEWLVEGAQIRLLTDNPLGRGINQNSSINRE